MLQVGEARALGTSPSLRWPWCPPKAVALKGVIFPKGSEKCIMTNEYPLKKQGEGAGKVFQ